MNDELDPATEEFAKRLKRLPPAPMAADPIAAALVAGRKSAFRQLRVWQGIGLMSLLLCGAISLHRTVPVEYAPPQIVAVQSNQPVPELSSQSVLVLQQAVLGHGLDGLPATGSMTLTRNEIPNHL